MQLDAMRQYAQLHSWTIAAEIEEAESGKKNDRADRDRIMRLARSGQIDVVLVWKLNVSFRRAGLDFCYKPVKTRSPKAYRWSS